MAVRIILEFDGPLSKFKNVAEREIGTIVMNPLSANQPFYLATEQKHIKLVSVESSNQAARKK